VPGTWRLQSSDNKQASEGQLTGPPANHLTQSLEDHFRRSFELYEEALDAGVARELARLFLPGFAVWTRIT